MNKDLDLLSALQSIENPRLRRIAVRHLDPRARGRICKHFCNFVKQSSPKYKLCKEHHKTVIKKALAPHRKSVHKILKDPRQEVQRGSGIFTILASALIPVIAQLIGSAVNKKKNS